MLLLFVGCASTDEIVLDSSKRPKTATVEVFKDGRIPERKFQQIAELSFLGPREDELKAQKFFVERAKKLGGDAVLFEVIDAGQKGGGSMYGYHVSNAWYFKGKVVVYQ